MLFVNPSNNILHAYEDSVRYDVFQFGVVSIKTEADVENINFFFMELKRIFNTTHPAKLSPGTVLERIYNSVREAFEQNLTLFYGAHSTPEERRPRFNSMIFGFCHFVQQAEVAGGKPKGGMIHFELESGAELFYPLSENHRPMLTKDLFDRMRKTQGQLTHQALEIFTGVKHPIK